MGEEKNDGVQKTVKLTQESWVPQQKEKKEKKKEKESKKENGENEEEAEGK